MAGLRLTTHGGVVDFFARGGSSDSRGSRTGYKNFSLRVVGKQFLIIPDLMIHTPTA